MHSRSGGKGKFKTKKNKVEQGTPLLVDRLVPKEGDKVARARLCSGRRVVAGPGAEKSK